MLPKSCNATLVPASVASHAVLVLRNVLADVELAGFREHVIVKAVQFTELSLAVPIALCVRVCVLSKVHSIVFVQMREEDSAGASDLDHCLFGFAWMLDNEPAQLGHDPV